MGLAERLASQGVVAAQVTVTAMTHLRRGVTETALLGGLMRGRMEAQRRFDVQVSYIFDVVCLFPDQAEPTLSVALRGREAGVIGLGLAGPEASDGARLRQEIRRGSPALGRAEVLRRSRPPRKN